MKFLLALFNNNSARMPLTILGILMVIMTIAFTMHIDKMDREMAESLTRGNTVNNVDNAYMYACADLARIINYAGMDAMKQMGETPVIVIEPTSRYNLSTDGECSVAEFNHNWARGMIMYVMNRFIQTNYMYNSFDYRGLAVNVEPLTDWKDINITYIYMGLDREVELPGLGANETYVTYWRVSVPLNISIVDLETDEIVYQEDLRLGNLITCRYPMLELLTYEYEERLDGADALMAETTTLAQIYTAGRGYTQYFYKGPKNIVDNDHLSLIVNAALMLDQGLVFNSVDGASVIEYMMQVKKILYEEENVDLGDVVMGIELKNGSVEFDPKADAAQSTGDPQNATKAMEKGLHIDFNATPIMDFLNNDSIVGGSDVSKLIEMIIPQVYSTSLATGIERETSVDMGEHAGYEASYDVGEWGEPDSMEQIDIVLKDTSVPGNLYGEIWRVTWTREHVWRHAYEVEYACIKPLPFGGFYVDMEPDFLDHAEPYPGESFYTLKLRNTNLLGPTGMYLLPSMNPWVCTVNSWYIEIEGEMVNFLIFDADNVCHPNPMFGHEWQVYQREDKRTRDIVNDNIIGFNLPITFSFQTGTFIAVPDGKIKGVGDKPTLDDPNPFIEESRGWKNEI